MKKDERTLFDVLDMALEEISTGPQVVVALNEVRSAFHRSMEVIELAQLVESCGCELGDPEEPGLYRYGVYGPAWCSKRDWTEYLTRDIEMEELKRRRNPVYLGDVFVAEGGDFYWFLEDPLNEAPSLDATEFTGEFTDPHRCETLLKLAETLGMELRDLLYFS